MQRARPAIYVLIGVLCVWGVVELSPSRAQSQSAAGFDAVGIGGATNSTSFAVVERRVFAIDYAGMTEYPALVPGTARVICIGGAQPSVVLENGDTYVWNGSPDWRYLGTFPSAGPVGTSSRSWGQLKARFRDSSPQSLGR